jgi:uncharacterized protein (DUF433 family)
MNVSELDRITFEPGKMGGRACVRGLRITVAQLLSRVAEGATTEQLLSEYPDLQAEDVRQALTYAAWLAGERVITA